MSMRSHSVLFAILCAVVPMTIETSVADTIELVDGTRLEGKTLEWWNGTLRVELADGTIREIPDAEIRTVTRTVQIPPPSTRGSARGAAGAPAVMAQAGGFAGQAGLPFQAGALGADPDRGFADNAGAPGGRKRFQAGVQGAVVDAGVGAGSGGGTGNGRRRFQAGIVGASVDSGVSSSSSGSTSRDRRSFRAGIQ